MTRDKSILISGFDAAERGLRRLWNGGRGSGSDWPHAKLRRTGVAVKDWLLVAVVVFLGAGMASYEVYLYKQRHDWDTVYDRVLSSYKLAYAHRDDPGNLNAVAPWREYEAAEKELENIPMNDADKLQKYKSLYDCGLSLKAYHDLKMKNFVNTHFEKDAAACAQ